MSSTMQLTAVAPQHASGGGGYRRCRGGRGKGASGYPRLTLCPASISLPSAGSDGDPTTRSEAAGSRACLQQKLSRCDGCLFDLSGGAALWQRGWQRGCRMGAPSADVVVVPVVPQPEPAVDPPGLSEGSTEPEHEPELDPGPGPEAELGPWPTHAAAAVTATAGEQRPARRPAFRAPMPARA